MLKFDIKTVSEANQREHWAVKARRKRDQQTAFRIFWKTYKPVVELPGVIIFTRYACNTLDTDNLAGAFKHVQDQLARELGIDDGSSSIKWRYEQERTPKREHYFTVTMNKIMSVQTSLFDLPTALRLKDEGIEAAAQNNASLVIKAREVAIELARRNGKVNMDDVHAELIRRKICKPSDIGNGSGSVFRDRRFSWTGVYVTSKRASSHGNLLREWIYIGAK